MVHRGPHAQGSLGHDLSCGSYRYFAGHFLAPSKTSRSPSFLKLVLPGNTEIVFCLSLLAVYQDICQGI